MAEPNPVTLTHFREKKMACKCFSYNKKVNLNLLKKL